MHASRLITTCKSARVRQLFRNLLMPPTGQSAHWLRCQTGSSGINSRSGSRL